MPLWYCIIHRWVGEPDAATFDRKADAMLWARRAAKALDLIEIGIGLHINPPKGGGTRYRKVRGLLVEG